MLKIKGKILLGLKILIILCVVGLTVLIFCHKSELTYLDLGRHIKNGEVVWQDRQALYENFYSYTEPDFPFINHHWLSGAIFYWLFQLGGFKLLTIFNFAITLITIGIIFFHANKRSNFWLSGILILPTILIMSERTNIRPEIFSYLFLVLTFYLLDQFRQNRRIEGDTSTYRLLFWLILIQLLWVNLHIYFFIGLLLISLALAEQIILQFFKKSADKKSFSLLGIGKRLFISIKNCKKLFFIAIACYLVCLANPNFLKGALYPLNILKKYGYEIVENKSPFYLENLMINYNITIFKILIGVLALSFIAAIISKLKKFQGPYNPRPIAGINFIDLAIALIFTSASFFAIRNLPMFALMILPITAGNFYALRFKLYNAISQQQDKQIKAKSALGFNYNLTLVLFALFLYSMVAYWLITDLTGEKKYLKRDFGLGQQQGTEESIKFYQDNNLSGPIFNNYDLGGSLIFWLYPQEKVFVDNRPEAYSEGFFKEIYKPMQQDDEKWKEYGKKYNFNLIYFSHTDGTPWANKFLHSRLSDKNWPLIYFDNYTVIMVKNTADNFDLIERYKIDSNEFKIRLNKLTTEANIRTLVNLADLAKLRGQSGLAQEIYQKILKQYPGNGQTLALMGYLLSVKQEVKIQIKALNYFNKAIKAGYKLPGIYNQMGLTYWSLGETGEAKKMWQNALKLDSNNEHAKYYLKQLQELL